MAKTVILKTDMRAEIGTKFCRRLRKQGRIPAVVYGHKRESVNVTLDRHNFTETLHHGHRIFTVVLEGKEANLLVKALQYDHLGREIIHADFMRVNLSETVKVSVPIEQRGTSKGSHHGGIIDELMDHIEIECLVSDIPDILPISIKELDVDESVHAKDIELPPGAKLMTAPEALVLHCHLVSTAKTTEEIEEEMPAGPEVITEKADEPEEGQDASK